MILRQIRKVMLALRKRKCLQATALQCLIGKPHPVLRRIGRGGYDKRRWQDVT